MDTAEKLKGRQVQANDNGHSGMNISADAIKTKLMNMSVDSETTTSESAFTAKEIYQRSNKEKAHGVTSKLYKW